jgi:hypothetical protein
VTTPDKIPAPRLSPEDLLELHEPYDMPDPYCDFDPPRLPPNAIVVDQLRGRQPGQPPSLAELLETGRTHKPEPDLEAEP